MTEELKPCPFCGKVPELLKSILEETRTKCIGKKEAVTLKRYVIRCNYCGAMSAPTSAIEDFSHIEDKSPSPVHVNEAIKNWNRRAQS